MAELGQPSGDASDVNIPPDVLLDPPSDCVKITSDGGVLKHIIREGSGDVPVLHARCLGATRLLQQLQCTQN